MTDKRLAELQAVLDGRHLWRAQALDADEQRELMAEIRRLRKEMTEEWEYAVAYYAGGIFRCADEGEARAVARGREDRAVMRRRVQVNRGVWEEAPDELGYEGDDHQ